MRTSSGLGSAAVHEAFGLVCDLFAQGADASELPVRLAPRLCALSQAQVCLIGELPRDVSSVKMPWRPLAEHGWRDTHQRHLILSSLDDPRAHDPAVIAQLGRKGDCRTFSRRELVEDDGWYTCRYFEKYRKSAGLDDQVFSVWSGPRNADGTTGGWMGIIGLHRSADDPPFDEATITLIDLLHRRFAALIWNRQCHAPSSQSLPRSVPVASEPDSHHHSPTPLPILTPAQLRVLPYILQGHREERIAELLHRSRHTVHDHITSIYKAFRVHGRVELILRFGTELGEAPLPVQTPVHRNAARRK